MNLSEVRRAVRSGEWTRPTAGLAPGYLQANLVILPKRMAYDFLLFCVRNPKPCPLLEVTDPGCPVPKKTAPGADLRLDLPRYRVYRNGEWVEEVTDIEAYWREDAVSFLLGCSFTFESLLIEGGIPVRHIEENKNVPMYRTHLPCKPAGMFAGPLVVSMRPLKSKDLIRAVEITSRHPRVHGAPVQVGDPEAIGITDLDRPDYGDAVTVHPGEIPAFWACGVTPQAVAVASRPEWMITHSPGHMFITERRR
ncbi:putative hydro-lyase [Paludifilum halophilum]|uniref:Putative hydro-lyase CHM34_14215 n=1 Tax=Paludifilum halophilum TaxID=1642702 RepID=A0A235B443_9BACL|nr:putative hydro-lyase [Paludifilum halophilum]OYD06729.1 DUF1445 domain-containing protein [Paludifilum halophilum]